MNLRLVRLIPVGVLMAVAVGASGCADRDDAYYGPEPGYEGPAYASPPAYYHGPTYRDDDHWRHRSYERHHDEDDDD